MQSRYGNCITDDVTEIPRCFSSSIQSDVTWRDALRARTSPAIWIAPPNQSSFSVNVVLPASGWEMMAKVRRRAISVSIDTTRLSKRRVCVGYTAWGADYTGPLHGPTHNVTHSKKMCHN